MKKKSEESNETLDNAPSNVVLELLQDRLQLDCVKTWLDSGEIEFSGMQFPRHNHINAQQF